MSGAWKIGLEKIQTEEVEKIEESKQQRKMVKRVSEFT
jgi:hypothetical protein